MHLWQIRQFPDKRKNQRAWHLVLILPILTSGLTAAGLAQGQTEEESPAVSTPAGVNLDAQPFFDKAVAAIQARKSIQATLVEQVFIGDHPMRMTGHYFSRGDQIRLELQVRLGGNSRGSLLEVCDGDILWNLTEIAGNKQVTLRNLKQIQAAMAEQPVATTWKTELGLGGIPGLMNSLERTMQFQEAREKGEGASRTVVLLGKWNKETAAKWQRPNDKELPPYIPDQLRIYFDPETLFPHRLIYLKRDSEKKIYRSLVRLDFQDVQLDGEVDEALFQFTPPEDLVPDDITQQYIAQFAQRNQKSTEGQPPQETKTP